MSADAGRQRFAPHAPRDWAWAQTLPAGQKIVLLAIAEAGDANGVTFQGQARISAGANLPDRTLRRRIAELEKGGYIVRYRRDRENGSRTSDLIVLAMPRDEDLLLADYARVRDLLGEMPPPAAARIVANDLPAKTGSPTGQNGTHLTANMLAGPEEPVRGVSTANAVESSSERASAPDQPSLDAAFEARVERFLEIHADRVAAKGVSKPTKTAAAREAARVILRRDDPRAILARLDWALGHPYWSTRARSVSKFKTAWDDLTLQWRASVEQQRERALRDTRQSHHAPEPTFRSVSYDGEKVEIT